ncbi:MAG: endolytic transglycosylase MltG [Cytophagaceae bacterium]|jgi:UPF0755 protein|nr:endolytic transglycosylase MltG [Cytophagaceae bacterium]
MAEKNGTWKLSRNRIFYWLLLILLVYIAYRTFVGANVIARPSVCYFYVKQTTSVKQMADSLKESGIVSSRLSFRLVAALRGLNVIRPGMYELRRGWNNFRLVHHFKEFSSPPTQAVRVPAMQRRNNMLQGLCKGTQVHPDDLWRLLNNKKYVQELGDFTTESVFCMFVPGTYYMYKNPDSKKLLKRIYSEYLVFWNQERLGKADDIGLRPEEVVILASIVYSETKLPDEMPIIAGVYINRLQKNMRLESDPTLVYAAKKYGTKRVLNEYKSVDSPYNTYRRKGLPPGPISIVPPWVIDLVLDYEGHDYLYFCAKPDFSGEHLFAETYEDHLENAKAYREELNSKRIF